MVSFRWCSITCHLRNLLIMHPQIPVDGIFRTSTNKTPTFTTDEKMQYSFVKFIYNKMQSIMGKDESKHWNFCSHGLHWRATTLQNSQNFTVTATCIYKRFPSSVINQPTRLHIHRSAAASPHKQIRPDRHTQTDKREVS